MLTPDEASRTWCPMARIARRESKDTGGEHFAQMPTDIVGGVNRDALSDSRMMDFPHSCRCLADKCAMWRWGDKGQKILSTVDGTITTVNKHGYCGLAGVPIITITP